MKLARDAGDISSLFPAGVRSITELPFTLHNAIRTALYFLSFDELPDKERPPKRIWLDVKAMEKHWRGVKAKREAEAKPDGMGSVYDMPRGDFSIEDLVTGG